MCLSICFVFCQVNKRIVQYHSIGLNMFLFQTRFKVYKQILLQTTQRTHDVYTYTSCSDLIWRKVSRRMDELISSDNTRREVSICLSQNVPVSTLKSSFIFSGPKRPGPSFRIIFRLS